MSADPCLIGRPNRSGKAYAVRQSRRVAPPTAAAPRDPRRGAVRCVQPGALQHRCVDLPDRTAGGRRAEEPRGCRGGDRDCARGRGAGIAARRRHLAMRADRGARSGHRLQQISRPGDRGRCRGAAGAGRAGGRPRTAQPAVAQGQAVLPGRPPRGGGRGSSRGSSSTGSTGCCARTSCSSRSTRRRRAARRSAA